MLLQVCPVWMQLYILHTVWQRIMQPICSKTQCIWQEIQRENQARHNKLQIIMQLRRRTESYEKEYKKEDI